MKQLPQNLTAREVLKRYEDEQLPAFAGMTLNDPNQRGVFGEHPLEVASVRGSLEEMLALIEGGADVNASGELGNTALHEAASQGQKEAVKLLLERGARRDVKNDFGQTALDVAKCEEIANLLRG